MNEAKQQAEGRRLYARLLGYVGPYARQFAGSVVAMVLLALTEPAIPAMLKPLLDGTFVQKDPVFMFWMPILLVGLFLVRGLLSFVSDMGVGWIGGKVVQDLRMAMFDRLLVRPMQRDPVLRHMTAWEMYEDFASEAGEASQATYIGPPRLLSQADAAVHWEKHLRRGLGDDYELLAEIGRGGFGRVYRVRDLHLERVVALKVLEPTLTQEPAVVERFRREAQLAARLSHTNVVDIYDIGGRYGLLWYTMELVEGGQPGAGGGAGGPTATREGAPLAARGALGAGACPCFGTDPPGHQAGEHAAHHRGDAQDHRLRPSTRHPRDGAVRRGHQPERDAAVDASSPADG